MVSYNFKIVSGVPQKSSVTRVPEISKDQLGDIIENVVRKTNTGPDEFEELDLSMFSTIDEQLEFLKQQDRVDTMYIMQIKGHGPDEEEIGYKDEPASVLLERIQAEREKQSELKKKTRTRAVSKKGGKKKLKLIKNIGSRRFPVWVLPAEFRDDRTGLKEN